jgi:hypothetical protein
MKRSFALGLVLLLGMAGFAYAGIPCAETSSAVATITGANPPGCITDLVACPNGDMGCLEVVVVVNDCYGTPVEGATVTITPMADVLYSALFCACTPSMSDVTDSFGTVTFLYCCFGGCGTLYFDVVANVGGTDYPLNPSNVTPFKSPDNDGSCAVGLADLAQWVAWRGTDEFCGNYDCSTTSPTVGLADLAMWVAHRGHDCSTCPQ